MGSGKGKEDTGRAGCLGKSVPEEQTAFQSPEGRAGSSTHTDREGRGQMGTVGEGMRRHPATG